MIKAVCRVACRPRMEDGKCYWCKPGEVREFSSAKAVPEHFEIIDTGEVDFETASEAELLEAKWKKSDAEAYIVDAGGTFKDGDKADIVSQILDARFRKVD